MDFNHIAIAGGIEAALTHANNNAGHTAKIEIEVDTLEQLDQVLSHGGVDIVMLDNFELSDLKKAIETINGRLITEASGGVNLNTVEASECTDLSIYFSLSTCKYMYICIYIYIYGVLSSSDSSTHPHVHLRRQ